MFSPPLKRRWRTALPLIFSLAPALILVMVLFGSAVLYAVGQSLGNLPVIGQETFGFEAYHSVLFGPSQAANEFWSSLGFSLWVSFAATLLTAIGALVLAVLLAGRYSPRSFSIFSLNISLAFPHLVWAIGLILLLSQSGLVARLAAWAGLLDAPSSFPVLVRDRFGIGIILVYVTKEIPFVTLILLAVLSAQPKGYELVAENLGAGPWQRLRYVTLPLVWPALLGSLLLVFAFIFGAYEVPAVLGVRYPRMLSVQALDFFLDSDLQHRAEGMAVSVLMALVVLAVALVANYLRERQNV